MSRNAAIKPDAPAAWGAWMASGSAEAAAQFFDRVGAWMDGTAAQLTRGVPHHLGCRPTRAEVVDRLRDQLGVLAAGGAPVTYRLALDIARQNVIEDLRSRPPN